jgi:hypothetical protein
MNSLNQIELQNIRHLCGHSTNFCEKISYYKTLSNDANVTDVLDTICTTCTNLKTELSNLL